MVTALSSYAVPAHPALQFSVYHAPPVPVTYQGSAGLTFTDTAFTLIHSAKEAVLVDSLVLSSTAEDIAQWIEQAIPGRNLTYIYITHGHFDHFGAFPTIQSRYPGAKVVAKADVIAHMKTELQPPVWDEFWAVLFPGVQKPTLDHVVQLPADGKLFLEGKHELRAVEVAEGDTHGSTVLHAPELGLVVGGDVVYGHCYSYLTENQTPELRAQWIESLETVKKLKPRAVVPSHMQKTEGYGVEHLDQTQQYIRSWDEFAKKATSWQQLETLARDKYPDRVGDFILRYSAQSRFNATF